MNILIKFELNELSHLSIDKKVTDLSFIFLDIKTQLNKLQIIPQEAKKLLSLLTPNEFFQKVKPLIGNQITLKQYEIFLWSIRFVLMSLGTKTKNFYSRIYVLLFWKI